MLICSIIQRSYRLQAKIVIRNKKRRKIIFMETKMIKKLKEKWMVEQPFLHFFASFVTVWTRKLKQLNFMTCFLFESHPRSHSFSAFCVCIFRTKMNIERAKYSVPVQLRLFILQSIRKRNIFVSLIVHLCLFISNVFVGFAFLISSFTMISIAFYIHK